MKNKEKYYEEILGSFNVNKPCSFKLKYIFKSDTCNGFRCSECCEMTKNWFEEEYKEPIKLTKNEKAILESLPKTYGWIVRDADEELNVFVSKPYKCDGYWDEECDYFYCIKVFNHLFQFIKWEDSKPYSIEELLRCEVISDE